MGNIHTPTDNVLVKAGFLGAADGNGPGVDCQGYERACLEVVATTGSSSTADVKIQESADNSTFTDVTGAAIAQIAASQTRKVACINVTLSKRYRYLRAVVDVEGTVTIAALWNLFNGRNLPPTQDVTPISV